MREIPTFYTNVHVCMHGDYITDDRIMLQVSRFCKKKKKKKKKSEFPAKKTLAEFAKGKWLLKTKP